MRANFDLNLLRIAVALYDEHSVTRAALKLQMSQPAVSSALKRLRGALADPLFLKTASAMTSSSTPTAAPSVPIRSMPTIPVPDRQFADSDFQSLLDRWER